jgi:ribose transport system ATP-binding protein
VLRDGRVVATRSVEQLTIDEIVRLMVGRQLGAQHREASRPIGAVALRVERLTREPAVREVSFEVRRGEVLGIAGLVGSGRTELLRAIFGADRARSGAVYVNEGSPRQFHQPREAVRAGLAMIPEDRKQHGLLLDKPVRMNATLAHLAALARPRGWINLRVEHRAAEEYSDLVAVQRASVEQPAVELSGGNQQKVVIARWLMRGADVLLFDEPTRGIDVAAKQTIYRLLGDLASAGKALVVVSSDLLELMAICDRMAVMSAGRMVATFDRADFDQNRIMTAAVSGYLGR